MTDETESQENLFVAENVKSEVVLEELALYYIQNYTSNMMCLFLFPFENDTFAPVQSNLSK